MSPVASPEDEALALRLAERTERLRRKPEAAEHESPNLVEGLEAGCTYGVELSYLRALRPFRGVTPVPLAPAAILGIVPFQGQVVPVVSLPAVLGVAASAAPRVLVFLSHRDEPLALAGESIPRAGRVAEERLRATAGAGVRELEMGGRTVKLIDVPALLAWLELEP